jgi:hypothetical protein
MVGGAVGCMVDGAAVTGVVPLVPTDGSSDGASLPTVVGANVPGIAVPVTFAADGMAVPLPPGIGVGRRDGLSEGSSDGATVHV